ncbi:MAG: PilZ domain-containing protein [Sphingomonadaceae bacterium]|nr:PilZ domain-containing protein [Sphingomonadaceae bacterium]
MSAGAQLTVTDKRRALRHPVDYRVIAEHRQLGDVHLHVINVSAQGFMATVEGELGRGERLSVRLPEIGRIEAHLIWNREDRSGFQFERIIRLDEFLKLIDAVQPNPRLRAPR